MPTTPPSTTALPTPPDPDNRATFEGLAYPWSIAQETLRTELDALAENVYDNAVEAQADAVATAADRVQTGLDVVATAADRVQTGLDVVATAADRVQTGLDVVACAALLDQFGDRYLGVKASDPALDNDGNPLVAGAIYINSVSGYLRAYTGTTWVQGISEIAGVESINAQQGALTLKTIGGESPLGSGDIDAARLSVQQPFTKPQRPSLQAETAPTANAITWDLTDDSVFQLNLDANVTTFNLTGTLASLLGYQYQLIVRYNGGTDIAFNAAFKFPGATSPTLTTTSGKIDIFNFVVASTDGGTTCYLLNTGMSQNMGA